jgi:hypothetical protein
VLFLYLYWCWCYDVHELKEKENMRNMILYLIYLILFRIEKSLIRINLQLIVLLAYDETFKNIHTKIFFHNLQSSSAPCSLYSPRKGMDAFYAMVKKYMYV